MPNTQPIPSGLIASASLSISSSVSIAVPIGTGFVGLSYEKSVLAIALLDPSNAALIALFRQLGPSVLRIGGNSVDKTNWTPNGKGRTSGQAAPNDVAALAAFLRATGWQCLYGINLAGSATGTQTPDLAAAEVAAVARQLGTSLVGIEIGNECDEYGNPGSYYAGQWDLPKFVSLWQSYRDAILAVTPGVSITGPASASHEATWTVPFGQSVKGSALSLLTQHYYRGNGQDPGSTAANLITPDTTLPADLQTLASGAAQIGTPFRITECNSYYNGGASGVSNAYCSSLWVIDFLFAVAQSGATGVNLHGGGGGPGYTPIANNSSTGAVLEVRPEYYGMLLFTLAGQGNLLPTSLSTGQQNISAYAVQARNGNLSLVVVNKESTSLSASIALPRMFGSATLCTLTQQTAGASAPDITATAGVTLQGATIQANGIFVQGTPYTLAISGTNAMAYVPALSAVLIQLS